MIRNLSRTLLSLALVALVPIAAGAQQLGGEGTVAGTRIEIRDLKRDDGGTVTLRFQLSNDTTNLNLNLIHLAASDSDWKKHYENLSPPGYVAISAVHLIDAVNKKKYLVVRDTARKCLCAVHHGNDLKAGQKVNLWAKFPAPPESVRKITVIVPRFEPIENVPITPR